ncbi:MAG: hypothetical protein AABX34_00640 [Nanoarchaeota archaeon]
MVQIRPGKGKFLSPERWNPGSDIFYEELINTGPRFREALAGFLALRRGQRPSYRTLKTMFGRKKEALRNYAAGALVPQDIYEKIASELKVEEEITPENTMVRGQYVSQVAAHFLDVNSMQDEAGIQKIIGDLEIYNNGSSSPATNNSRNRQWIHDFLLRAHGSIPMALFQNYEQGVIEALRNMYTTREDITREGLMKAFNGPVETLEDRLRGTTAPPKKYSLFEVDGRSYTINGHNVGERIITPYGLGIVTTQEPFDLNKPELGDKITVALNNGDTKMFISNKYQDSNSQPK